MYKTTEVYLVIDIKEIVKGTQSDGDFNAITLVSGVLYKMPESDNSHRNRSAEPRSAEGPIKKCSIDVMNAEGNALEKLVHVKSTPQIPNDSEISVGALYDPKLMLDYGGEVFSLDKAKLIQPNWCKMDNTLIVPWKNYLHLRQGTLIVVNISIRMHVLQPKNRKKPKQKAYIIFVYQAIINFLKVVAESDIPVAYPPPPTCCQSGSQCFEDSIWQKHGTSCSSLMTSTTVGDSLTKEIERNRDSDGFIDPEDSMDVGSDIFEGDLTDNRGKAAKQLKTIGNLHLA
ncbi:hypothetical protein C8J55DRAFT_485852 [Lentinula edodes]|uniref:Uncharacterized protein n=1 Tax=Lentinula lateritia TaxID=40482 RepID=A0A9W9AY77_9AGAR|nr:hypothetical protein C8J55DRAFT_485852 [Lentinula edodes]